MSSARLATVIACIALVASSLSFLGAVILWDRTEDTDRGTATNRVEAVWLLCDLNDAFRAFVIAEPTLPRDKPTLERLARERCDEILADARDRAREIGAPPPRITPGPPRRRLDTDQ